METPQLAECQRAGVQRLSPAGRAVECADRRDDAVGDRDIADIGLAAKSVDDDPVAPDEIECHPSNLR